MLNESLKIIKLNGQVSIIILKVFKISWKIELILENLLVFFDKTCLKNFKKKIVYSSYKLIYITDGTKLINQRLNAHNFCMGLRFLKILDVLKIL